MRNTQFASKGFQSRGGGIGAVLALSIDEVQDAILDRLHAQALAVKAQPADFAVKHADPAAGERGVALKFC
jgi:hypothetical protein